MVSMMWNGYYIYIKIKSRGEQSAANTELAELSVCIFFEKQDSLQVEAILST